MNSIDISKRNIGVNFINNEAEVTVWAPTVNSLDIHFKNEKLNLKKTNTGYWQVRSKKLKPNDLYKLIINNVRELPDPASLYQPEGVHGHSQAYDPTSFKWTDGNWKNIPLQEYIIYELHIGTFTETGTFGAIENKLDYLKGLGINAIEIMPVAQFPGNRNWGYDGVFPFAVQNSYGGPEKLQHLVNTCHQKGICVILDVVYNHLGPEGNYLGSYGPYFTDKYKTPWGHAINFDDAWCDGVRRYFIENALMWLRDFHIDALRLDAVHAIKDLSPVHILREIKQNVNLLMQQTGRHHYLIVELDLNDNRYINPLKDQGYGMDAQWIDEFHHALRVTAGQEKKGYYSDFNGIEHLAKAYKDAYVYDGQFSPYRKKSFGIKTENPGHQFIVFSQNHDQVGNRMLGERTSSLASFEMQKLLAGAVMISPYIPMLFMGEEWSEPHPFQYFVSHTDTELAEAVRNGRKAEFAAFHLEGDAPDPMSKTTFEESKLQWNLRDKEPHKTMLHYYKNLIDIRKHHPAFKELNRKNLLVQCNKEHQTLTLHRWHDDKEVICLLNFSTRKQSAMLPSNIQQWEKILDSADPAWQGPSGAPNVVSGGVPGAVAITLQPESILIYSNYTIH